MSPVLGESGAAPFEVLGGFFDRILVVTLARAKDRQARVRERLAGLPYEFVEGFDKAHLDKATLAREGLYDEATARQASRYGRDLTLGHLGCSLSHRRIYEETIRHGWRRVLVFEDDVVPRPAELSTAAAALAELPPDWELVYLGYENFETVTLRDRLKQTAYLGLAALRLMKWTPAQVRRFHPRPFSPHLRVAGLHHCTHAYGFTLDAARKLLAAQTPVARNADQLLLHLVLDGALRAFVTEPQLFDQERYAAPVGGGEPHSFVSE